MTETDDTEEATEECKHELRVRCVRCGLDPAEATLALARQPDPEFDAAFERALEHIERQLVTTVRVEPAGAHERVTVWIRNANVGTLTVGAGDGELLARLLLSEDALSAGKALVREWLDRHIVSRGAVMELADELTNAERFQWRDEAAS